MKPPVHDAKEEPPRVKQPLVAAFIASMRTSLTGEVREPIEALSSPECPLCYWRADPDFAATVDSGSLSHVPLTGSLLSAVILVASFWGLVWSRQRLSALTPVACVTLADAIKRTKKSGGAVLLIGPPRAAKDEFIETELKTALRQTPDYRIRLLDAVLNDAWTSGELATVDRLRKDTSKTGVVWVHVSNLEAQLVTPAARKQVLRLLEKLFEGRRGEREVGLLITTTVDPVLHFAELFDKEREQIYADETPELELNRASLVLSRFTRCYYGLGGEDPWSSWCQYKSDEWREVLRKETSSHRLLLDVRDDVEAAWKGQKTIELNELRRAIRTKADACYQLLWTSCTRSEKLVLIHLAQESVVNPKTRLIVDELIDKGLIVSGPVPMPFNLTFRDFLRQIERSSVVAEWESSEGNGLWAIAGRLVALILAVGGLFFLITQGVAVQNLVPLLGGSSVIGIPLLRDVVARFAPRKSTATADV